MWVISCRAWETQAIGCSELNPKSEAPNSERWWKSKTLCVRAGEWQSRQRPLLRWPAPTFAARCPNRQIELYARSKSGAEVTALQRMFLNCPMRFSIATSSFATSCTGLFEMFLSGHDSACVVEFLGHFHFEQLHEFLHLRSRFRQQLILNGTVDHDFGDAQAA